MQTSTDDRTQSVSDPQNPDYDPDSPFYDVTADPSSRFYVGPIASGLPSGDEIREDMNEKADQFFGTGFAGLFGLREDEDRDRLVQDAYLDRVRSERDSLSDEVDLRSPGPGPRTLWANASHEQMQQVISSNADSSVVAVSSEEWVRLGNELGEHQRQLGAAIKEGLTSWEGEGGDAARTHLAHVAKWLGSTAQGAVLTGRQQEIHSQTLNETQKQMAANPPVEFSASEANARLARITEPMSYALQFNAEMQTYHQQQVAREQAARVMHQYDEAISGSAETPRFTPPPPIRSMATTSSFAPNPMPLVRNDADGQSLLPAGERPLVRNYAGDQSSRPVGDGSPVPNGGGDQSFRPMGGEAPVPNQQLVPGGGGVPPIQGGVPSGGGVPPLPDPVNSGPQYHGTTTTAGFTPPGSGLPTGPGAGSVPLNTSDVIRGTTVPNSSTNFGYAPPPVGSQFTSGERTTRLAPGGQGGSDRSPAFNQPPGSLTGRQMGDPTGGGRGPVPGGGAPGGGRGFGPVGGATPGGMPAGRGPMSFVSAMSDDAPGRPGGAPGPGGPGGRGAGPAGPMGGGAGGGGGRGKSEDEEYQAASYLEGEEGIFAPGDVVSPPVIGDWQSNREWK